MITFGLAQINPIVGNLNHNLALLQSYLAQAREQNVEVLVFPELAICGYPPEDLLLRPHFIHKAQAALNEFASDVPEEMVAIVGFPHLEATTLYNGLAVIQGGKVRGVYRKMCLPNYGVFDEQRYFSAGHHPGLLNYAGTPLGLTICEDIWVPHTPATPEALAGAQIIINISASPYYKDRGRERENMLSGRAVENAAAIIYCNLVGGQDELVFDGQSMVVDHGGRLVARAKQFEEELLVVSLAEDAAQATRLRQPGLTGEDSSQGVRPSTSVEVVAECDVPKSANVSTQGTIQPEMSPEEEMYAALVLGTKDYLQKNGFKQAVLGLSGGIDSALVALVAVDALGVENVRALVMPSTYSSEETQGDAEVMARNLGIRCDRVEIAPLVDSYQKSLAPLFVGREEDVTEENIQARIRGNLLMAISNKFGAIVLTTGNKSEMSVGYFTIFGDAAGGFDCLADVPKLHVYALTRWRNEQAGGTLVPEGIIVRPPSAELRPGQEDTDSLPPYEILDPIIELYVEQNLSREEIGARGFSVKDVDRVISLLDRSEYKRRMAPPGLKITPRAYGRDWRLPLTNGYLR